MRFLFTLCMLVITALAAQAQKDPVLFSEGNQLYRQQQYREAAARYQQLIDSGYQVADLYFNAGNAYLKSNQVGMAVYSFEKALHLKPGDAAVEQNLYLANQRVSNNIEALPLLFFERWWLQWQQLHSARGWAVGSIVWFWILCAGIISYFFMPGLRHVWLRWGLSVAGVLFIGYFSMAVWMQNKAYHNTTAIVMQAAVKVKAAPDEGSKDLFQVGEGIKVEVLDGTKDFSKVQLADGKTGWMPVASLKKL